MSTCQLEPVTACIIQQLCHAHWHFRHRVSENITVRWDLQTTSPCRECLSRWNANRTEWLSAVSYCNGNSNDIDIVVLYVIQSCVRCSACLTWIAMVSSQSKRCSKCSSRWVSSLRSRPSTTSSDKSTSTVAQLCLHCHTRCSSTDQWSRFTKNLDIFESLSEVPPVAMVIWLATTDRTRAADSFCVFTAKITAIQYADLGRFFFTEMSFISVAHQLRRENDKLNY